MAQVTVTGKPTKRKIKTIIKKWINPWKNQHSLTLLQGKIIKKRRRKAKSEP